MTGVINKTKNKEVVMTTNLVKRNNAGPSFSNVVDHVFRSSLNRFFDDESWGIDKTSLKNVPVNIRETDRSYELELMAPGCSKEDFKINLQGNLLTISFEHSDEKKEKDQQGNWVRQEYQHQSFTRSFTLDDSVDAENIGARYENGVLQLSLPKTERAARTNRNIEIS
ncbi:Hsp20/alpha crystallin family protein [Nostoc ellipsosporum NOK]|nr:Hsp20/alpha crystallin family protein [Nostoc ellipsosporum NOK]